MPGAEIIESACRQIMTSLKEGKFTKKEIEFLLKFFQNIVIITEKLLERINLNVKIKQKIDKNT